MFYTKNRRLASSRLLYLLVYASMLIHELSYHYGSGGLAVHRFSPYLGYYKHLGAALFSISMAV